MGSSLVNTPNIAVSLGGPFVLTETGYSLATDFVINASANGANTIVAGVATRKIRVLCYTIIAGAAVNATWESSGGTVKSGALPLVANGGASPAFCPVGHFDTLSGEGLTLFLSGGVQVSGHGKYCLV